MNWSQEIYKMNHTFVDSDNHVLAHEGTPHDGNIPHSGRWAWGSGEHPHQHDWDFVSRYDKMKVEINPATGKLYTDSEMAAALGYFRTGLKGEILTDKNTGEQLGSVTKLKAAIQMSRENVYQDKYELVKKYKESINPETGKPYGFTEIAKILNLANESTPRTIYEKGPNVRADKTKDAAEKIKAFVDKYGLTDVGGGVNYELGINENQMKVALERLKQEGYIVSSVSLPQFANHRQKTNYILIDAPGTDPKDMYKQAKNMDIMTMGVTDNKELLASELTTNDTAPLALDPSRVRVKYAEDGGTARDGNIEIRAIRNPDGTLSPACPDLSLGKAKYAQVRILVDGGEKGMNYIKGMATYSADLPPGCDIQVNSNKHAAKGMFNNALKEVKKDKNGNYILDDASAAFGSAVQNTYYIDKDGVRKKSPINVMGSIGDAHVEGNWDTWNVSLASQFLSKQSEKLVRQQLKLSAESSEAQYDKIMTITNPAVRRKMLLDFAESCDGAAVSLKAVKLPHQQVKVLLPNETIKPGECYCPGFKDGDQVAVVRYPHAGPFEVAFLTVNNKNKKAREQIGVNAKDAIGISSPNNTILSGADYDGDTGNVILCSTTNAAGERVKVTDIKSHRDIQIKGLENFDPSDEWGPSKFGWDDKSGTKAPYRLMPASSKGREMGVVSNLITDMYAHGCSDTKEIERADKYSMVVIDSVKHNLNWQAAKKYYNIDELQRKYQIQPDKKKGYGGASSLMSKSKSTVYVEQRNPWKASDKGAIDPETGAKIYSYPEKNTHINAPYLYAKNPDTGKYLRDSNGKQIITTWGGNYVKDKDGNWTYDQGKRPGKANNRYRRDYDNAKYIQNTEKVPLMGKVSDARDLLSPDALPIERMYADYANHEKAMANKARKEYLATTPGKYNKAAAKKYAPEVASLDKKYRDAMANSPRERAANLLATKNFRAEIDDIDEELDGDAKKKMRGRALDYARKATGAHKDRIKFSDREWEAIQAGAIGDTKLTALIGQADKDSLMEHALPKEDRKLSKGTISSIRNLLNGSYTSEEIADLYGISASYVSKIASGEV